MIITLTYNRPQIKELATCIANQTLKPDIWYIINNHGENPEQYVKHVNGIVNYEIVENNIVGSKYPMINGWRKSFELFKNEDEVIQFDDDDYMPPKYFQERFEDLSEWDLTGCSERRYVRLDNMTVKVFSRNDFSVTSSTAFTNCKDNFIKAINLCDEKCTSNHDLYLSREFAPKKKHIYIYKTQNVYLTHWGIGHGGTCSEHRKENYYVSEEKLKEWFGDDLERYKKYQKKS